MSVAELKVKIAELSAKERSQIAAFINQIGNVPVTKASPETDRRMKAMDAGEKVTAEQLEKQHEKLKAQGR